MSDFYSVPLKKPYNVDIVNPLKNLLSNINGNSGKPKDFTNQVNELSSLRTTALWNTYEIRKDALKELYSYHDQLSALEKKIPAGELKIPFKWRDAFCKGSFLSKSTRTLTVPSIEYEKICVLFNIAALQSCIGTAQNKEDDDGLKVAAQVFEQSAGIFNHLQYNVLRILQRESTPDLYPETLTALSCLMMAQAQEVFVHKSVREKMKNKLIAKVANETSNFYREALSLIQNPPIKHLWDKETVTILSGKQALFRGMAEFYQGLECKTKKAVGEHIARVKVAIENLRAALKFSNKLVKANELISLAETILRDATKDNDNIFHDKVSDSSSLSPIGRAALVVPLPPPQRFSTDFCDLFPELVPVAVQKVLVSFENRKREMVRSEIYKLREATQLLNGILASLNLPAAIEDTVEQNIPQSLIDKSTKVRDDGGADIMGMMIERIPHLQSRNTNILGMIEKMLNDEEESDDKLRKQFKDKWTRKQSSRLTCSFRTNLEKYRTTINTAIRADSTIKDRFEEHKSNIELLGKGPSIVAQAVPQAPQENIDKDSQSVSRLRTLLDLAEEIKFERDEIVLNLALINGNSKDILMKALDKGNLSEEALIEEGLDRIFKPILQKVKRSHTAQERLVVDIKKANEEFLTDRKELGIASRERENILKELATAFNAYMEISKNIDEGAMFYNELTQVLIGFESKVVDFCFARKTEKEELLRELERERLKMLSNTSKQDSDKSLQSRNVSQPCLGATASGSTVLELPYPTCPRYMPLPYASHIQLPPPQYYMPPVPNVYYTTPLPPGYQAPFQEPGPSSDKHPPSS